MNIQSTYNTPKKLPYIYLITIKYMLENQIYVPTYIFIKTGVDSELYNMVYPRHEYHYTFNEMNYYFPTDDYTWTKYKYISQLILDHPEVI